MTMRRPKAESLPDKHKVKAVIGKGGGVASSVASDKPKNVQLRLLPDIIQRIDFSRKCRIVPPTRHAWLLEAILEKLERDE
jgi:hypothetical protein